MKNMHPEDLPFLPRTVEEVRELQDHNDSGSIARNYREMNELFSHFIYQSYPGPEEKFEDCNGRVVVVAPSGEGHYAVV